MTEESIILFIDDEANILNSLTRSLSKWMKEEKLSPRTASSAHEALGIMKEVGNKISVIVTDQRMPDLIGSKLAGIISKQYPDIAIIILSGYSDMSDMSSIVKAGVFSFVSKPWNLEQLQNEIHKAHYVYNLRRENRIHRERYIEELRLGAEFQKAILGTSPPLSENIDYSITYRAVSDTGVSGDYYDIIQLDSYRFIVLMGDVSGHGIKASFLTAVLKTIIYPDYIKNLKNNFFSPSHFMNWLNKRICAFLDKFTDIFITFSAALVDLSGKTFVLANAGQPPVFLVRSNKVLPIETTGLVLGVDPNSDYKENRVSIQPGDRLFFCSDGIYPTGNNTLNFDMKEFMEILHNNSKDIHNHKKILKDLKMLIADAEWDDDITIVSLKILEG
ncbi:MAG: SpoIIE family protein phosphatase [Spirochaetales bacterium]|nr:SpoIIE family protein phosphatase [Spirochaetales bacterium]